jgi:tetratricopeptide (TPR) repeat protein
MTVRRYMYKSASTSGYVEAESVALARERLAAQGLADASILDDDYLASLMRDARATPDWNARLEIVARESPSGLGLAWYVIRSAWMTYLLLLLVMGWIVYSGSSPAWMIGWGALCLALFGLAFYPAWMARLHGQVFILAWKGDWEGVERAARRVKGQRDARKLPVVQFDMDGRIAAAWVMQGRLDDAIALIAPWRESDQIPAGSWSSRMSLLYWMARDWDRTLEYAERWVTEAPDLDSAKIDHALYLLRLRGDEASTAQALALLDGLEPASIVPLQKAFIGWARGVALLKRGDDAKALEQLAVAVGDMQAFADQPVILGALALASGSLAVAMARCGRGEEARLLFESVRPIVERHGEDLLLAGLRDAGLLPVAGS